MKTQLDQVLQFQNAFGQIVNKTPSFVNLELAKLRFDLMKEENEEYLDAVNDNDLVEIADALADQLYILCGTILTHGMQDIIEKCFNEVQRSNMSKLDSAGLPIINGFGGILDETRPIGKILKSPNFSKPNLKQFIHGSPTEAESLENFKNFNNKMHAKLINNSFKQKDNE